MVCCVRCLTARQTGTGQVFTDPDDDAFCWFIYAGESICLPHFNLVRGHSSSADPYINYDG